MWSDATVSVRRKAKARTVSFTELVNLGKVEQPQQRSRAQPDGDDNDAERTEQPQQRSRAQRDGDDNDADKWHTDLELRTMKSLKRKDPATMHPWRDRTNRLARALGVRMQLSAGWQMRNHLRTQQKNAI